MTKASQEKGTTRTLQIEKVDNSSLFQLRFQGGGELPDRLKDQHFTSPSLAQVAIEEYTDSK
jgi:hypothetical protein